jgi:hypothetical protein
MLILRDGRNYHPKPWSCMVVSGVYDSREIEYAYIDDDLSPELFLVEIEKWLDESAVSCFLIYTKIDSRLIRIFQGDRVKDIGDAWLDVSCDTVNGVAGFAFEEKIRQLEKGLNLPIGFFKDVTLYLSNVLERNQEGGDTD